MVGRGSLAKSLFWVTVAKSLVTYKVISKGNFCLSHQQVTEVMKVFMQSAENRSLYMQCL